MELDVGPSETEAPRSGDGASREKKAGRIRERDRPPQRKRERRPYHKQALAEQIDDPAAQGVRVGSLSS